MTASPRSTTSPVRLPVVPAPQDDELISSWLDRTARFYDQSIDELLSTIHPPGRRVDLAAVDLGTSRASLAPIASLLGITVEQFRTHTINAAFPRSANRVARGSYIPSGQARPNLRYAACYYCLEQQKVEYGFSWLRREWVRAAMTMCTSHRVILMEGQGTLVTHPAWEDYQQKHDRAGRPVCSTYPGMLGGVAPVRPPAGGGLIERLERKTMVIQDAMLAGSAGGKKTRSGNRLDDMTRLVRDLLWAFTRADREFKDRLVYEAFSSDSLENNWMRRQRRKSGPLDFTRLHVSERYTMLATATLLAGPHAFRQRFYHLPFDWQSILGCFHRRLKDAERDEFAQRQRRWPPVSPIDGVGPDIEISVSDFSQRA